MSSHQSEIGHTDNDQEPLITKPATDSNQTASTENISDVVEKVAELTTSAISPTTDPEKNELETCIICRESSTSLNEAVLCGHKFHEECLLEWLAKTGKYRGCPTCKDSVFAIKRESADAEKSILRLPAFPGFSPLEPIDISDPRLRNSDDYADFYIRKGPWLIKVERSISLLLKQSNTDFTYSDLKRHLSIRGIDMRRVRFYDPGTDTLTVNNDARSLQDYEKAMSEVTAAVEQYLRLKPNNGETKVHSTRTPVLIHQGERNISAGVHSGVRVDITGYWPPPTELGTDVFQDAPVANITWEHSLYEYCPAIWDDPELELAVAPTETVEYFRQTCEQIRGTIEWFFTKHGKKYESPQPLDKGITNLFEPCKPGGKCGYCEEEHRTGDCLLPWE